MAGEGKRGLRPHKTISDTERSRRETAEAHAQRFITGEIRLQEFVQQLANALAFSKYSS